MATSLRLAAGSIFFEAAVILKLADLNGRSGLSSAAPYGSLSTLSSFSVPNNATGLLTGRPVTIASSLSQTGELEFKRDTINCEELFGLVSGTGRSRGKSREGA